MTYDIDKYDRQGSIKWFDWNKIQGYESSYQTRSYNEQKLWFRSTIDWSLSCEETLSREDAFAIFNMEMETLGFVENFWPLGFFIIILAVVPHVAYIRMTKKERSMS